MTMDDFGRVLSLFGAAVAFVAAVMVGGLRGRLANLKGELDESSASNRRLREELTGGEDEPRRGARRRRRPHGRDAGEDKRTGDQTSMRSERRFEATVTG